jgi:hypothetical protein
LTNYQIVNILKLTKKTSLKIINPAPFVYSLMNMVMNTSFCPAYIDSIMTVLFNGSPEKILVQIAKTE